MTSQSFRYQFRHYVIPGPDAEALAFSSGLIVLDTNVLLDVYRFAPDSRQQLLNVIEQLRERIWIPHQVGEEFYRNRIEVMTSIRRSYAELLRHVSAAKTDLTKSITEKVNQLSNRVLLQEEKDDLLQRLNEAFDPMVSAIETLQEKHQLAGSYAQDPILDRLKSLLEGRVGGPFTDNLDSHLEEAKRRIEEKEPPGFKDDDKDDAHGDYFVWRQALDRAKELKVSVLLLVTSDTKADWYHEVQGQKVSARTELAQEAFNEAGCQLIMMDTATFLRKSREYANVDVSAETIREAEGLPRLRESRRVWNKLQAQLNMLVAERAVTLNRSKAADARVAEFRSELDHVRAQVQSPRVSEMPESELNSQLNRLSQLEGALDAARAEAHERAEVLALVEVRMRDIAEELTQVERTFGSSPD